MFVNPMVGYLLPLIVGIAAVFSPLALARDADKPLCLYVASYHPGYAWSDRLERAMRETLGDHCDVDEFYMDTRRNKTSESKQAAGRAAYEKIQDSKPDVIITSDDNAAKYLIVPHLTDSDIPVVFSGINWTVKEYGFPMDNVTGIVEVAPIEPMLLTGIRASKLPDGNSTSIAYLGAMTLTEVKNVERVSHVAKSLDMEVVSILADTFDFWKHGFIMAQKYDLVIIGNHSGIPDFDAEEAKTWAHAHTRKLSLTNLEWMMPYTAVGYTKIPEEQGEWAGATAIAVLGGVRTMDIPLVTNRRWDTWINSDLLKSTGVKLKDSILIKAKKVQ